MSYIQSTSGKCPACGKRIPGYNPSFTYNGSPIRTCTNCRSPYLDRRYREPAATDSPEKELSISLSLKAFFFGLIFLLLSGGYTLFTILYRGYYSLKIIVLMPVCVVIMVVAITDMIQTKNGTKLKKLEKERAESEQRLMNKDYARQLAELGYDIPDKYL